MLCSQQLLFTSRILESKQLRRTDKQRASYYEQTCCCREKLVSPKLNYNFFNHFYFIQKAEKIYSWECRYNLKMSSESHGGKLNEQPSLAIVAPDVEKITRIFGFEKSELTEKFPNVYFLELKTDIF